MANAKSLASLSSTLLARKGTARPAMRPQGFGGFGAIPTAADDLGWNDMGEPEAAPVPPVLVQREMLAGEFTPAAEAPVDEPSAGEPQVAETPVAAPRPVSVATATRIRRETHGQHKGQARSAFTLRLDTDRHLKLRLASALRNQSAQLLVTEALDAFLDNLPEVALLMEQLPAATTKGISR